MESSGAVFPDHRRMSEQQSSSSSSSSSSSQLSLSKVSSFTKLNAQAPEFVPRVSSSSSSVTSSRSLASPPFLSPSSSSSDLGGSFRVPHLPALNHVYNGSPAPAAWTYAYSPQLQFYTGPGRLLDGQSQQQDFSVIASATPSPPALQGISDVVLQQALVKNGPSEDISQKILNQVEFYFSDVNLATTGFLFKIMSKDPEGYVPLSAVASIKKIKTFSKSLSELATVLRSSSKLVVSHDGKMVKRQHPLTESDIEEVQSRIVIAENLPGDHCHQNLMKIFSAVGSVKSIRTCQPSGQSSMPKATKTDGWNFSNKVHAFVEYETSELADKAVTELNEDNWRNGLKVRLLLKQNIKSAPIRVRRTNHEGDATSFVEEDAFTLTQQHVNLLDDSVQLLNEPVLEEQISNKDGGVKKGSGRGREHHENNDKCNKGKGRGHGHGRGRSSYMNRGNIHGVTSSISSIVDQSTVTKQPSGPRMPDGTRGFSMGRGKQLAIRSA